MEAGFLADIAAHPEDDAPRLIFADWLEDHGQPERAELIRLQCRLEPDRVNFRYVLALLLMRRKRLKFEEAKVAGELIPQLAVESECLRF